MIFFIQSVNTTIIYYFRFIVRSFCNNCTCLLRLLSHCVRLCCLCYDYCAKDLLSPGLVEVDKPVLLLSLLLLLHTVVSIIEIT